MRSVIKVAIDFFAWALGHGQNLAESLDSVPLPLTLVSRAESYIGTHVHS